MQRHEIQVRTARSDNKKLNPISADAAVLRLDLRGPSEDLRFGLHQMIRELADRSLQPTSLAIDLLVLAIAVQVADTRIARHQHAQDSWTREIDLNVPVSEPKVWNELGPHVERMLRFLSGDIWSLRFRKHADKDLTFSTKKRQASKAFDSVCLFSGGMDSYLGAIDLLSSGKSPLLVSHYWDLGTSSQATCAGHLSQAFGDITPRHIRVRIGADKSDFPLGEQEDPDNTQRARSFIFFAMAAVAASALSKPVTITVPENGFVSLNVPLDTHRLGAYSTRTTHPFYMAGWNHLLAALDLKATVKNPYQCMTKGEMILATPQKDLVAKTVADTISCSSVSKARWSGHSPGHCGHCFPCLIRRAAENRGLGKEVTTYQQLPDLNRAVEKEKAIGEHLWSFRVMAERISRRPHDVVALVNKTGPLLGYSRQNRHDFADVFRRGIAEVAEATKGVSFV